MSEEVGVWNIFGGFFKDFDEAVADAFAFFLWIVDAGQVAEELFGRINDAEVDVEVVFKSMLDEVAFFFAEEAVVDEDAGELVADGFVEEGGDDGGVDPA